MGELLLFKRKIGTAESVEGRARFAAAEDHADAIALLREALALLDRMAAKLRRLDDCFAMQPLKSQFEEQRAEILEKVVLAHRAVESLPESIKACKKPRAEL